MAHANITLKVDDISHELRLALTRYERLSSPPLWMMVPVVSSVYAYEHARDHAIDIGNEVRAKEIQGWLDQEWRRRELLAQWKGEPDPYLYLGRCERGDNWKGRTLEAWQQLLVRMWHVFDIAVNAGVLDRASESYRAVSDRIRDVERRVEVARDREFRGEPAIA